jgi:hypothetical protein
MFPWKDFLLGRIRKNSKTQGGKGQIRRIFFETRRKEWRKEKEEIFMYVEVPILVCFPSVVNALGLPPSCDPPSGEPTHMGTSPTTKFPINTGVKIGVHGREITVWYSPQMGAVVMGPIFMLVNFLGTKLWRLWQKYVSLCFEPIDKPTLQILDGNRPHKF